MGFGGGVGVASAEEAANNGEENEYEVEGVAAVLNCTRFEEDVGSERVQRRRSVTERWHCPRVTLLLVHFV